MAKRPTFGTFKPIRRIKPKSPFVAVKPIKLDALKNLFEADANKAKAIEALRGGKYLTFTYEGLLRVAHVHTVGTSTADRPAMSVRQVDGQTNSPPLPRWGLFCFDECFNVALSNIPAPAPHPEYKKGAKQFKFIDAEL